MALNNDKSLREHVVYLLKGGGAHVDFEGAIKDLASELRGKRPKGAQHSPWEILEHMRLAQWDILEFSRDPKHQSPAWPEGYWPGAPPPPNERAWAKCVRAFRADRDAMCSLVADPSTDLLKRIEHGDGQDAAARVAAGGRSQCVPSGRTGSGAAAAGSLERVNRQGSPVTWLSSDCKERSSPRVNEWCPRRDGGGTVCDRCPARIRETRLWPHPA
jgi:hypothetical protein